MGAEETRWNHLAALVLAAPYVVWAAWRPDGFGDTAVYRGTFLRMPTGLSSMVAYLESREKGRGFVVFEYLFKTLVSHSDIAFFFTVAAIQILLLVYIFRKYSNDYWLSFFFFIASTDYLSWMHNGMRQFIAVTIIFAALPLLVKRRYLTLMIIIIIAAMIHSASLLFVPFLFVVNGRAWNQRTVVYIIGLIIAVFFVDRVTGIILSSMKGTVYEGDISLFVNDDGTNIFRVLFYAVPTAMSFVFRPYIDRANNPLINTCVNLSIISTGIYVFSYFTSGIMIGAIPIYFSLANYLLIPWMIDEIFDRDSALLIKMGFIGAYIAFFYYQVGTTWHLL